MTRDKIIQEITEDSFYLERCKYYTKGNGVYEDLYQFIILTILEIPEDRLISIHKVNMKGYINRMIWTNATSKTAPFYRQHRYSDYIDLTHTKRGINGSIEGNDNSAYGNNKLDLIVQNYHTENDNSEYSLDLLERVKAILNKESQKWLNKGQFPCNVTMLELYSELGSMRELARKTEIPYSTIRYNIDNLIKKIHEDLDNNK